MYTTFRYLPLFQCSGDYFITLTFVSVVHIFVIFCGMQRVSNPKHLNSINQYHDVMHIKYTSELHNTQHNSGVMNEPVDCGPLPARRFCQEHSHNLSLRMFNIDNLIKTKVLALVL